MTAWGAMLAEVYVTYAFVFVCVGVAAYLAFSRGE